MGNAESAFANLRRDKWKFGGIYRTAWRDEAGEVFVLVSQSDCDDWEVAGDAGGQVHCHPDAAQDWRKAGYQEWLRTQARKDLTRDKERFALEVLRENDAPKIHEAYLQVAASQLSQLLADFDPSRLLEKLQTGPQNFVRLLNALPKLATTGLLCETQRWEMAGRRKAAKQAKRAHGLSDEARKMIEENFFDPPDH